jgi:hypothetical protein
VQAIAALVRVRLTSACAHCMRRLFPLPGTGVSRAARFIACAHCERSVFAAADSSKAVRRTLLVWAVTALVGLLVCRRLRLLVRRRRGVRGKTVNRAGKFIGCVRRKQ